MSVATVSMCACTKVLHMFKEDISGTLKTFLLVRRNLGNSEGKSVNVRPLISGIVTKELMVILLAGLLFCRK
jgi:hypothetical protein